MSAPSRPALLASLLVPSLLVGRQEAGRGPSASVGARPGLDFRAVVRANLRAAARHVLRNHLGPSFRECSRPSCRNASDLVPYPVVVEAGVAEAELEVIFQRVVTAALEEVTANPALIEMGWEDPVFVF